MSFKDHFSTQSSAYSRYRPGYPAELFQYLASLTAEHELAWDCATGSGQAALALTPLYSKVIASDASQAPRFTVHFSCGTGRFEWTG